ncbi:hypothetical protein Q31b_03510 [Novipirellula aureliae]|uniref:Uncharacterized protein n=1 Tax=Novipirellula aureliae TaxID=2527966 RepID=A0A5C6E8L8_9BACT|nr:hypothetical protein Q31b_03510 [Novipirellula aureliae]
MNRPKRTGSSETSFSWALSEKGSDPLESEPVPLFYRLLGEGQTPFRAEPKSLPDHERFIFLQSTKILATKKFETKEPLAASVHFYNVGNHPCGCLSVYYFSWSA